MPKQLTQQAATGSDSALERLGGSDDSETAAVAVGHRVLDAVDDEGRSAALRFTGPNSDRRPAAGVSSVVRW
jgi:hypothetical protein